MQLANCFSLSIIQSSPSILRLNQKYAAEYHFLNVDDRESSKLFQVREESESETVSLLSNVVLEPIGKLRRVRIVVPPTTWST
jgi:hypothetical protein